MIVYRSLDQQLMLLPHTHSPNDCTSFGTVFLTILCKVSSIVIWSEGVSHMTCTRGSHMTCVRLTVGVTDLYR